jgi:hypothetical protein
VRAGLHRFGTRGMLGQHRSAPHELGKLLRRAGSRQGEALGAALKCTRAALGPEDELLVLALGAPSPHRNKSLERAEGHSGKVLGVTDGRCWRLRRRTQKGAGRAPASTHWLPFTTRSAGILGEGSPHWESGWV